MVLYSGLVSVVVCVLLVVGSGDFGRFVVFLPLWGASAASHIRNAAGIPLTDRSVEHRRFIEHRTRNAYS